MLNINIQVVEYTSRGNEHVNQLFVSRQLSVTHLTVHHVLYIKSGFIRPMNQNFKLTWQYCLLGLTISRVEILLANTRVALPITSLEPEI